MAQRPRQWQAACEEEKQRYVAMAEAASRLSAAREQGKAALLMDLAARHERVLAFDRRKVRKSMVSSLRRCSPWRSAQRGETGSSSAHLALMLEASDAMVM